MTVNQVSHESEVKDSVNQAHILKKELAHALNTNSARWTVQKAHGLIQSRAVGASATDFMNPGSTTTLATSASGLETHWSHGGQPAETDLDF